MHLVLRFAQKNARSSAAVYEATYGLGNDGLETSGFAVVSGTGGEGAWWAVAVLGDAGISDGVVEVRNCRVGARNAIRNVRDISSVFVMSSVCKQTVSDHQRQVKNTPQRRDESDRTPASRRQLPHHCSSRPHVEGLR